jgi:transposase
MVTARAIAPARDPAQGGSQNQYPCDFALARWRHLMENRYCNVKQWRGIATRYDKIARSFAAMINPTTAVMG